MVLRYETGKLPSEVPLKTMFPKNHGVEGKIARLYRQVLFTLYGVDIPEELLLQAMDDAHTIFSLVTDRTGLKKKLVPAWKRAAPA